MAKVYVFLADGFEEIEGLTVVDLLRRVDASVLMVSITSRLLVKGSHGIEVMADMLYEEGSYGDGDMLVLPGGMPGTKTLMGHEGLRNLLVSYDKKKKYIAAICAAPSILGRNDMLQGKEAVCFPGFEEDLVGALQAGKSTVIDGHVITSKGLGTSIDFSLAIIKTLFDAETANKLASAIQYEYYD